MTSNQLQRRELVIKQRTLDENRRHNLAQELLSSNELAETVSNNLRNYKINLSKNQITRLANNQLNAREVSKIYESMRHNLAVEEETARNNKEQERETRIRDANSTLGKPGKYSVGSILAAIFGLMPADELERLYGKGSLNITNTTSSNDLDKKVESLELPDWNKPTDVMKWVQKATKYSNAADEARIKENIAQREKDIHDIVQSRIKEDRKVYPIKDRDLGVQLHGHSRTEEYSKSFPEDKYTGPGVRTAPIGNLSVPSGEGKSNPHGRTSGGTNYTISSGIKSSGIIYQGGNKYE